MGHKLYAILLCTAIASIETSNLQGYDRLYEYAKILAKIAPTKTKDYKKRKLDPNTDFDKKMSKLITEIEEEYKAIIEDYKRKMSDLITEIEKLRNNNHKELK